jgi:hypothetical protein
VPATSVAAFSRISAGGIAETIVRNSVVSLMNSVATARRAVMARMAPSAVD